MIPTITDLNANDNATLGASRDAQQISVLYRKLANDQANVTKSYEKTLSRIIQRHNENDTKKLLSWENENSLESYVRPKTEAPGAANKTLTRMMENHGRPDDSLVSWENDNFKDFYKLNDRSPTDDDHNEAISRIMATQTKQQDAEYTLGPDKGSEEKFDLGDKKGVSEYLRSIDNTETNILDVLHKISYMVEDITEGKTVASQKAREMDHSSSHGLGHIDQDSLLEAFSRAIKDGQDKDPSKNKKDGILSEAASFVASLPVVAAAGAVGLAGAVVSPLLPHNKAEPSSGFTGSEQKSKNKASSHNNQVVPKEIQAPEIDASSGSVVPRVKTPRGKRADIEMSLFKAFKKQGYTDEGAKTMVAEVGRENGFNENLIFGSHIDPGNHVVNSGMISWQKDRRVKLMKFLQSKGLLDKNGKMIHSQAGYDAQAEFLENEMKNSKHMSAAHSALFDKSKSYKDIEGLVGDEVIAWTRTHPGKHMSYETWLKIRNGGYRNQNQSFAEISELLKNPKNRGMALNQQSSQNSAQKPVVVINNDNRTTNNNTSGHKAPAKPHIPPARSSSWDGWQKYFDWL